MNTKRLVSIIIPVYNTEKFLDKCIQSVLSQTYKNIEIIIIDDGSTDNSYEKLQEYKEKDNRIILLQQKNSGQGVARNKGIDISKGEYICFIDSDDRITESMVEEMILEIEKTDSDFSSFLIAFEDLNNQKVYKSKFNNKILEENEIFKNALRIRDIYPIPVNKIYKKDFLIKNNISFPKIRKNEDMLFIHKLAFYAKKCSFVSKVFYYAWRREGSTSRNVTEENIQATLSLLEKEKEFLIQKNSFNFYEIEYKVFYIRAVFNILLQALFYKSKKIKEIQTIINNSEINKYLLDFNIMKRLPFKHKILIFLYKINCLNIFIKILIYFDIKMY